MTSIEYGLWQHSLLRPSAAPTPGRYDTTSVSIGGSGATRGQPPESQDSEDNGRQGGGGEEHDEDAEDAEELPPFPISHEAFLKEHKKVVSALAVDPSGARFASGSHDYDVKLWDFGGMGGGVGRPFKSFEPAESYYVSPVHPVSTFVVASTCQHQQRRQHTTIGPIAPY